ncbi:uncharacterized protein [Mytilus edulis]|uniref:uncharacterized protein isoform X1 n=1 Tax=Mytilus edulis TaxID=6550 RepID=UPI0039EF6AA3
MDNRNKFGLMQTTHSIHTMVMTITKYKTLYTILIIFVILSTGHSRGVQSTLCEHRCETATPYLITLKLLWHRMSKRIGRQNMTFESFVKSLIAASERYNRLIPLRDNLMSMIGEYQDCVKACEHQHSKRTFERVSDSFTRPEICITPDICL